MEEASTKNNNNLAVLAHASAFIGMIIPFGNVLAPLVIFLTQKDQNKFVGDNAREALNFQISMTVYMIISAFLALFLIGFFLIAGLIILWLVAVIMAMVKASEGTIYKYPLTINFIN